MDRMQNKEDRFKEDGTDLRRMHANLLHRNLRAFQRPSDEIPTMLGRSTKELAQALGAEYERELVHRDDLVLL